ncbi:hypothetical protein [Vampirovibrio chlorellavorus]|uniref:hypothetical protein n=1 Tax=Vampirovibrio chlorellavorus TaxID=758823 RepID=UPI0026F37159|nr:hypothetical protein [Vampirovibrio chlorellavorus]
MPKLFPIPKRIQPASLGSVMLATLFSTVLSPSLWLLQLCLSRWLDWKSFLSASNASAPDASVFYALVLQLKSLGSVVLLTQLLPVVLLCLLLSVIYHWCLLRLLSHGGQLLQRTLRKITFSRSTAS